MKYILILIGLIILLMGCPEQDSSEIAVTGAVVNNEPVQSTIDQPLKVEPGDMVKVDYTGTFQDGNVFDTSEGREPLQFMAGVGQMIPGFDNAVIGMGINEEKHIVLPPEEAYGTLEDVEEPYIDTVSISILETNGISDFNVGMELFAPGATAVIKDINMDGGFVTMEVTPIPHPLAGETLIFDFKVVEILKQGIINTP